MQRHKQRHPFNKERLAVVSEAGCVQYLCTLPDPLREQSSASFIIKWPWLMKPVLFSCTEKCTAWPGEMTFSLHSNERSATEGGTGGQVKEPFVGWREHIQIMTWGHVCVLSQTLGIYLDLSNPQCWRIFLIPVQRTQNHIHVFSSNFGRYFSHPQTERSGGEDETVDFKVETTQKYK